MPKPSAPSATLTTPKARQDARPQLSWCWRRRRSTCATPSNSPHQQAMGGSGGVLAGLARPDERTGRACGWAWLVTAITLDFTDPATGGPLPGRGDEWSLVTEYRVELAREARDWATATTLQTARIEWDRHQAAAALAALRPVRHAPTWSRSNAALMPTCPPPGEVGTRCPAVPALASCEPEEPAFGLDGVVLKRQLRQVDPRWHLARFGPLWGVGLRPRWGGSLGSGGARQHGAAGGRAWACVRPEARPPGRGRRLAHAAAPGGAWRAGPGSPAPMPLSTFVTFRFLSNLTVTKEPSALVMCASYTPSPASVSIR